MDPKHIKWIRVSMKKARVKNHRSVFAILGSEGSNQIPVLYKLLTRGKIKDISVLLCSNSDKLRQINWSSEASCLSTEEKILPEVTYLQYRDIPDILYQSFNLIVLHDIEDVKPSSLASIAESVKGGGAVIFLFNKIKATNELSSFKASDIKSRFIQRLWASFTSCPGCIILDDKLNNLSPVKDVSGLLKDLNMPMDTDELQKLKNESTSDPIISSLINLCRTVDQAKVLLKFLDALKKRTFHSMISVSSPKGRGKSAALGLAIAGSLALNYSNIFISSSSYDNVKIAFRFLFKGLDALNYKEDQDYDLIQSVNPKFNNALLGVNVFRDHPQAVRFILPGDVENKLEQAELVVIDEAAAIPLPLLNRLLGSYVVLMASTTEGYGGAGKFLYENVLREVRQPTALKKEDKIISSVTLFPNSDQSFEKLTLSQPIYYASGDHLESWINQLLCLESSVNANLSQGCPAPTQCRLFYVCREILFSFESYAEKFLQQLMSLFLCSKRTISPDFMLKIADDPDYHIFCLLSPFESSKKVSPEILCAILVHAEKQVPFNTVYSGVNQQENLSDCFNEWTSVSKENEQEFLPRCGIHIIDIVTHPECRRMGYGLRSLHLLQEFYDGKWIPMDDTPFVYSSRSRTFNGDQHATPPLLLQLSEVEPEKIEYILVSYFLTPLLLRFWKKNGFIPIYISKEKNSSQEHLCLMLKSLANEFQPYLQESWRCFCEYYFLLLSSELKTLPSSFALNLLKNSFSSQLTKNELTKEDIDIYLNPRRMKSLEKYCQNLSDLHCIMPCVPIITKLFFRNFFSGIVLPVVQEVILLSFGLQHKTVDEISKDLGLPSTQVHGLLNRTIRKLTNHLSSIIEKTVEKTIKAPDINMEPVSQSLDEELEEAAQKIQQQQLDATKKLKDMDFSQYAIRGTEDDWEKALHSGRKTLVSIKSIKKPPEGVESKIPGKNASYKRKKQYPKKKK